MRICRSYLFLGTLFLLSAACAHSKVSYTNVNQNAVNKLDQITEKIQSAFELMDVDLSNAAKALSATGLSGQATRTILKDMCLKHPLVVDCVTIDTKGKIVAAEPAAFKIVEGVDVNNQEQFAEIIRTHKPVFSKLFKAVEGFYVFDFEWPVFAKDGAFLGSVSAIVRPEEYMTKVIKKQLSWDTYNVWVVDENSQIVYSSYADSVGENILAAIPHGDPSSLSSLIKEIVKSPSGMSEYRRLPTGYMDSAQRMCIWKPVSIYGRQLRIALFIQG